MKGLPLFPIAVILLVFAGVGYAVLHGNGEDEPQTLLPTLPPGSSGPVGDVYISDPQEGAVVSNPVTVRMGSEGGLFLAPAGDKSDPRNGHFHIFIDRDIPISGITILPADNVLDLDTGAIEAVLPDLAPGEHTIHALFSDTEHEVTEPPVTASVTFTVE